jgi:hypothetical protein
MSNPENLVYGFEKPFLKFFESWSERTLTLTLLAIALFVAYVAIRKDYIHKGVLLTWLLLP